MAVPFARGCDHVSGGHLINHSIDVCLQIEPWNVAVALMAVDEDECTVQSQRVHSPTTAVKLQMRTPGAIIRRSESK